MLRKSLCLLLALLMIFPLLVACSGDGKKVKIVVDGSSEYSIICPAGKDDESKAENVAASTLYSAIKEKTGVSLTYADDTLGGGENQPEEATEILVGATNRLESQNALELIRAKDFTISYANGRVVIVGGTAEATARAVDHFIENYIDGEEKTVTFFEKRVDSVLHNYLLGNLSINGVPLRKYTIVYPKNADLLTYYTAVNLADYLLNNAGIALDLVSDSAARTEYELLVGETNRTESKNATGTPLADDEYILLNDGGKIVMLGNSYMVGGAAGELVNRYFASQGINVAIDATDIPTTAKAEKFSFPKATSAILMIGDGMGNTHIDATLADGKLDAFVARDLPYQSFCTTASQSVLNGKKGYTDSAAAATALATGYKTLNGYLGLDANKISRQNIRELAHSAGARTAVLTTDVITGATPAGFLCHHNNREQENILQGQIDNLVDNALIDYCKGSVSTLIDPAREALTQISEGGSDFFIMIEEAHIDKHSHYSRMSKMQDCVVRYNECIAYVIGFVMLHPSTALIITADHETGGLELKNGEYVFTNSNAAKDYWQHTNNHAPVFGIGGGVETLIASATTKTGDSVATIDNTDIAKFIADIFGSSSFGQ